jgi:HlyD family secretion protein
MKRFLPTVVLALLFATAGWFARQEATHRGWLARSESAASQTNPAGKSAPGQHAQETVVGMGRIEPAGGVIDVGAMMGDRLGQILVKEGDQVEKGARLAELESHDLRSLELEAAVAQFEQAQGRLEVETQLADVKIQAAELGMKKAEAADQNLKTQEQKTGILQGNLVLVKKDQERIAKLSKDLVSDQERERQTQLVSQAESELDSARAALDQLRDANRLGLEAANLDLAAAKEAKKQLPFVIPVRSLEVSRKLAEAQFRRTEVTAPCNGTILKIYARPGETIGNKPILQIADLQKMVVTTEVYENEVRYLRVGQKASVASRALPSPYDQKGLQGEVTRIGRMINSPMLRGVDPFAPADRHVVEVRVELDDEGARETATLTNLQVDVRFPKKD